MLNISVSFFNVLSKFIQFCQHASECPTQRTMLTSQQHAGHVVLYHNVFSATSKLGTPSVYCWSRKTLVAIHWTHLRVNALRPFVHKNKKLSYRRETALQPV